MIERNKYLNELIYSKENGFPKVITGIRRCGKSFLLNEIYRNYLIKSGVKNKNILYIDLNRVENIELRDPIYLNNYVLKYVKNNKNITYVFLDEIQQVFELVNPALTNGKHIVASKKDKEKVTFVDTVLGLANNKNIDLYVTGSNSKMLSTDIVTEFRDKATNIYISPLSFEEFLSYKKIDETKALNEYMLYGGMPLAVINETNKKEKYLKELFDTTYFKDILERNGFKKEETLDELCTLLSVSVGSFINSAKIVNLYKEKTHGKIDDETVESYINAFLNSFILKEAKRYDLKGKKIIKSTKKYYFIDTGLRNARLDFMYSDIGQLLENVVYNELIYNDYNVNVGTFDSFENDLNGKTVRNNYEIDFLATKGNRMYYIQVCNDISDYKTHQREIKPYIKLNDQIQKIIVINSSINETRDQNGFTIIGIFDFLLRFIK